MQNLSYFVTLVSDTLTLLAVLAIWQELRNARRRRGWTIEEAAWEVGVNTSTYHRWELGVQIPHPANLAKLYQMFALRENTIEIGYDCDTEAVFTAALPSLEDLLQRRGRAGRVGV